MILRQIKNTNNQPHFTNLISISNKYWAHRKPSNIMWRPTRKTTINNLCKMYLHLLCLLGWYRRISISFLIFYPKDIPLQQVLDILNTSPWCMYTMLPCDPLIQTYDTSDTLSTTWRHDLFLNTPPCVLLSFFLMNYHHISLWSMTRLVFFVNRSWLFSIRYWSNDLSGLVYSRFDDISNHYPFSTTLTFLSTIHHHSFPSIIPTTSLYPPPPPITPLSLPLPSPPSCQPQEGYCLCKPFSVPSA